MTPLRAKARKHTFFSGHLLNRQSCRFCHQISIPFIYLFVFGFYVKVSNLRFPFLTILFFAGASFLCAEKDVEKLESTYKVEHARFETETRSELTRIARDKSLTGEEKVIRTENWFVTHSERIAEINRMADTLDERKPIVRPTRPPRRADTTPEGIAAAKIHQLNLRLSKGEIASEEFNRLRKPITDQLSVTQGTQKRVRKRLSTPASPNHLTSESSEEEIAREFHAQNRYLESLPEGEAAEARTNQNSPVNHLLRILETKYREAKRKRDSVIQKQKN